MIKKIFIRGLGRVLPITITLYILISLFIKVDQILQPYILEYLNVDIPGIGFVTIVILIFVMGSYKGKYFSKKFNKIIKKVPLIGKIYTPLKQVAESFKEENESTFDTVVEVYLGNIRIIGFLTNKETGAVFIPSSPTPISGFVIYPEEYIILDMTVEEALTKVISLGALI